jgi:3-phenylpropionate/trans-cinnamate dioxygenase ferredoxin reductase component
MAQGGMVIIGGGKAGARACVALRENGWEGAVTLISDENHAPYDRPPLSKSIITEADEQGPPFLTDEPLLASINVDFIKGNAAKSIDRAAKRVTLADGGAVDYDRLLIATGSLPRRLPLPGAEQPHLLYLRSYEDSLAIRHHMERGGHAIIIGGGFIGLEIAASAKKRGLDVTVIEGLPRVLSRGVPEEIAAVITQRHEAEGTRILCGVSIEKFEARKESVEVSLKDGTSVRGDFAVIGIGAVPVTGLAEAAGLAIENGIAVDDELATSDPDIFAAGDCVSFPLSVYGGRRVRLESWRSAQDHGAIAAANMLGKGEKLSAVPWFWSDQHDLSLQIAGLQDEGEQSVRRDLGNGAFITFHLKHDGRLVAASGIGVGNAVARDIRLAEMLIGKLAKPSMESLADPAVSLKALLKG